MTDSAINHRYQTILMYEQKILTAAQATKFLGVIERHLYRVAERFEKGGRTPDVLKHRSHTAWNRTCRETEGKILALNRDNPEALNSHVSWLFWHAYGKEVAPATVRNILIRHGAYTPFRTKKERAYKKFQATHFGALVQLHTADGYWLKGYPMLHLIVNVNDATRTPLAAGIFEHDSTLSNMAVMKEIIRKYGVPALFYTDNDSKFKVIRHGKSSYQTYRPETLAGETETEIRRALREAGSGLITHAPFQPQGKGKVEKLLQFVQNCYLANHKAKNLEEPNQGLQRWLRWYDQRGHRGLGEPPQAARERLTALQKVAFRKLPRNIDLDTIFSVKEERKLNKYNIFSYQGKQYQLPQERVCYPGKVELRILPDNSIRVFNKEKELVAELKG